MGEERRQQILDISTVEAGHYSGYRNRYYTIVYRYRYRYRYYRYRYRCRCRHTPGYQHSVDWPL